MSFEEEYTEMQMLSQFIKEQLKTGELKWGDEPVQFFLPVIIHFTEFDWLRLIAENALTQEDEVVVKNFLIMVEGLMEVNSQQLESQVHNKVDKLFRRFGYDP